MRIKKILIAVLVLIFLMLTTVFLFKNSLLQYVFEKIQLKAKTVYHVNITSQSLAFSGFKEVELKNLVLIPDSADTLLKISLAKFDISIWQLIRGKIGFNEIQIDTFTVNAYNQNERNNISFLKRKRSETDTASTDNKPQMNNKEMLESVSDKVFKILNTKFIMNEFTLTYKDSLRNENLRIPHINYDKEQLTGQLISLHEMNNDTLFFNADVIKRNHIYDFSITQKSVNNNYLPFFNINKQFRVRFQSISGTIDFEEEGGMYNLKTNVTAIDFHINYWRLANEDVVLPFTKFDGLFKIESDAITLDSSSVLKLNHAMCSLFVKHEHLPKSTYALQIKMNETPADSFFTSLPQGMFNTLKGIKTTGTLSYHLNFKIDKEHPDSLIFDSELKKKNFKIKEYGAENYSRINDSFLFDAMDGDRLVRQITVGYENPMFTPYDQISDYVKNAIMTSEDGSFMYHRGFNEDAFRQSIITNYKEQRFARGGSTITMQLVKNCFLSRNKTVSRKAEEALIVWLIENNGLVSKERMLEVYLNVIEWGPDVYGIGEASGFYFGKQPKDLTLAESIYLASIIPHPKYFKYSFDTDGNLKPFLASYYRLLSNKMLGRNWITPDDTTGLQSNVKLSGPAKQFILPVDTLPLPSDSLLQEDLQIQ